jgi:hypothetical protein
MRQERIIKSCKDEREIAKIGWAKQKKILQLLAGGKHLVINLAAENDTDEKTIHRIRAKAIKDFYLIKRELPISVQNYLRSWAIKHNKEIVEKGQREINREKLEQHKEDLYIETRLVLAKLYEYCAWPDDMTIGEINVERDDLEAIGLFRDELVIDLFEHLQNDIEGLNPFARWEDLTPKDINTDLLKLISQKAVNRDFGDKCRILLNGMKSKSQA